jgi:hypothetical protein
MRKFKTSLLIGLSLLPALSLLFFSGLIAVETWPFLWGSTSHAPPPPVSPSSPSPDRFSLDSETKQFFLAVGAFLLTTVSTLSTLWLAWRGDKRQSREFELKIEQLQLQLDEAKKSKVSE